MAASMRTLVLLGLVMAAFCVAAQATSVERMGTEKVSMGVNLNVKVALQVNVKQCYHDVRVFVGVKAKGAVCAAGALTVLKPVTTKLVVADLLYVDLEILGKKLLKVRVVVDLKKVKKVKLIGNVHHIVLDLVEDVKTKQLVVLCLGVKLNVLNLVGIDTGL